MLHQACCWHPMAMEAGLVLAYPVVMICLVPCSISLVEVVDSAVRRRHRRRYSIDCHMSGLTRVMHGRASLTQRFLMDSKSTDPPLVLYSGPTAAAASLVLWPS